MFHIAPAASRLTTSIEPHPVVCPGTGLRPAEECAVPQWVRPSARVARRARRTAATRRRTSPVMLRVAETVAGTEWTPVLPRRPTESHRWRTRGRARERPTGKPIDPGLSPFHCRTRRAEPTISPPAPPAPNPSGRPFPAPGFLLMASLAVVADSASSAFRRTRTRRIWTHPTTFGGPARASTLTRNRSG